MNEIVKMAKDKDVFISHEVNAIMKYVPMDVSRRKEKKSVVRLRLEMIWEMGALSEMVENCGV